jgi:hypothetical protein
LVAGRIANIVILVEDMRTENLLRRYLQRLGQDNRNIRVARIPDGRGSGEQFVRERYASEVQALRNVHTKACLIVSIDADTKTTAERRQQLERALREAEEPPRDQGEPAWTRPHALIPDFCVESLRECLPEFGRIPE